MDVQQLDGDIPGALTALDQVHALEPNELLHVLLQAQLRAEKGDVEVTLAGPELHVRIRDARRRVSLPASLEGRAIERADLKAGTLEVVFSH